MERKGDVGKLSIVQESGRDQHIIDGGGVITHLQVARQSTLYTEE